MPADEPAGSGENGIVVPYHQLDPQTLRHLVEEFVSRDGADWAQAGGSLEEKVEEVLSQLRSREAKLVFDLRTNTANIVPCR